DAKAQDIYQAKQQAIGAMFVAVRQVAKLIVENRVKPRTIDDRLASNTLPQPAGVMATAAQLYAGIISGMIIPQQSNEVESLVSQGKTNGWSVAGTYYYVLAASQKQ